MRSSTAPEAAAAEADVTAPPAALASPPAAAPLARASR
jgi:hypothetical protein